MQNNNESYNEYLLKLILKGFGMIFRIIAHVIGLVISIAFFYFLWKIVKIIFAGLAWVWNF